MNKYVNSISYIKCDIHFGVPLIAFLGLMYSFWAFEFFLLSIAATFFNWSWYRHDNSLFETLKKTHYVFAFTSVYLLYIGFKDLNKKYIRLWYDLKVFESVCVIIGGVIFVIEYSYIWIYYMLAIIALGCGYYLINCVQQGFDELPSDEDTDSISSEVNQKLDNLNANTILNEEDEKNQIKIPIDSETCPVVHK